MKMIRPIHLALFALMLLTAFMAQYMTPTIKMAEQRKVNLETLIPKQFGDWKMLPNQQMIELPPELAANLAKIYTETLSRTYVNSRGQQVMLSIAYGADQSDGMGVHRPEVCYPAQGFTIAKSQANNADPNAVLLVAQNGSRIEPIMYWMIIGEKRVLTARQHKLEQVKYGLKGLIPDGMLVRISSINSDTNEGFALNRNFSVAMLQSLSGPTATLIYGAD